MFYLNTRFLLNLNKIISKKKININNQQLEGVFNSRYRKIKKLGEGAQGTVFEVEDLTENRK